MANGHGGYRQPSQPAAVSGPGAHSQRTDGRPNVADLSNAKYGENADFRAIQGGAAMGAPAAQSASPTAAQQAQPPVALGAESQMPDVPVTSGADAGAGPGASALGLPQPSQFSDDLKGRLGPLVPWLIRKADDPHASQDFRDQVRFLLANL
jgi:hypothetical protein